MGNSATILPISVTKMRPGTVMKRKDVRIRAANTSAARNASILIAIIGKSNTVMGQIPKLPLYGLRSRICNV
jgi:hypothetical protein